MKKYLISLFCLTGFIPALKAADFKSDVGIVNFNNVISESKYGKQEQEAFESLKKQMVSLIEDTEKQLNELTVKFNDSDYLDGLSPEGEMELKTKYQNLSDELGRYQNQYYQVMNQANMRLIQKIVGHINEAAGSVAKRQKISFVINKDACFYYDPKLDVTSQVIDEMNISFEKEEKAKKTLSAQKTEMNKEQLSEEKGSS